VVRSALGFLTVWPVVGRPDPRAALWFAPIGAFVGVAVGTAWWAADQIWPALVAAIVAIIVDAALTGMLHLDGLADTGDGLLSPMDREERLAAMSDPHVGAFGVVVVVSTLLLRTGAFASLTPDPILIAAVWAASRAGMTVTLGTLPLARPDRSLASAFVGNGGTGSPGDPGMRPVTLRIGGMVAGLTALVVVVAAAGVPDGLAAAAGLVGGSSCVVLLAHRRLGGFTGDVLGAAGVVGETCALLLAAARW
jgi:adenosylcobinamide-GDP ribazoletransferase